MFVQTQNTPNPNSLKFIPGKKVSNSGSFEISDKEKVKIFQPYRCQSKNEYCIITELKLTKSSVNQDLELYGVPSVSFGYEDARWQAVSRATYSFKKDEELVLPTNTNYKKIGSLSNEIVEKLSLILNKPLHTL